MWIVVVETKINAMPTPVGVGVCLLVHVRVHTWVRMCVRRRSCSHFMPPLHKSVPHWGHPYQKSLDTPLPYTPRRTQRQSAPISSGDRDESASIKTIQCKPVFHRNNSLTHLQHGRQTNACGSDNRFPAIYTAAKNTGNTARGEKEKGNCFLHHGNTMPHF